MNIVIVEDEIKIRNGLSRLLSSYKEHDVIAKAKNGVEGLECISNLHPDLVFTDIKMPEMDGLQMLEELKKRDIVCHSVILTGYAEFDYAKRAITCGADEYLLKPITVDAVDRVLESITNKISAEAIMIEANPESYIRAIIMGLLEMDEKNIKKSKVIFDLKQNSSLCFVRGYSAAGNLISENIDERFTDYNCLYMSEDNKDVILLYDLNNCKYQTTQDIVEMINRRISVIDCLKETVWYVQKLDGVEQIKEASDGSDKKLLYELVIDGNIILDEDIPTDSLEEFIYDRELEKQVEKLLVQQDENEWNQWKNQFYKSFMGKKYNPFSVRQAYNNLAGFILQFGIKMWPDKVRLLRELETVDRISKAKLLREMQEAIDNQAQIIFSGGVERNDIHNYTILKVITYVREHYSEKFSQEDVANYLSITPEYLSTIFHREMNKNFSVFVNEFRVSHAKRLLKSSDLKIYEIAKQVGFTDTKYFNKVFKEIVGASPKEFRER